MRITYIFLSVASFILILGCAGPKVDTAAYVREQGVKDFENAYISYVNLIEPDSNTARTVLINACTAEHVEDIDYYITKYIKEGYMLAGEVLLDKGKYTLDIVASHCGKVGAESAIYSSKLNSSSMISPKFHFSKATYQGLLGNYMGNYSNRFTEYDSRTIDLNNNNYTTWATYWAKANPPILGAYYGEIPDKEKYEAEAARGAYVYLVVNGSPADRNNVIPGDIITRLDGYKVYSPNGLTEAISAKAGEKVNLHIIRKGEPLEISMTLNPS